MISAGLVVEGHAHGLGAAPRPHHMTFAAEPCRPWPSKASPPTAAAPEFARPLPKHPPQPIPAARYNGAHHPPPPPPINGCRPPPRARYQEAPVNLAAQHKDGSPPAPEEPQYPRPYPGYHSFHGLAGPYGPLYPAPPHYAPPPPGLVQPRAAYQPVVDAYQPRTPPYTPPEPPPPPPPRRPFKVPSGKEGSLKHRILTRPPAASPDCRRRQQPHSQQQQSSTTAVVPANFSKGSLVQLASGELKRVEELRTQDFVSSAEKSAKVKLDPSTVVRIHQDPVLGTARLTLTLSHGDPPRAQVDFETRLEHPFFVYGQGWASCDPARSLRHYGLSCHQLQVGDICISLTPRAAAAAGGPSPPPTAASSAAAAPGQRKRRWSAPDHFLDGDGVVEPQPLVVKRTRQ